MLNPENIQIMIQISQLVLFVALIVLTIYLIINIKKITGSVSVLTSEVKAVSVKITPLISDISLLVKDAKKISDKTLVQINNLESVINSAADKTNEILSFINKLQGGINLYLGNGINFISALKKGISTFARRIKTNDPLKIPDKNYYHKKVI